MSSTYSTNLAIELMGAGDQAGNWGSTTNTNLGTLIEQAISGYQTQSVATGTDTTVTIPNGATGVARNMFLELTGTGGASTNLLVPANKKLYFIYNNSTGAVTVKVSGQTGVSVPATAKIALVCNGTDIVTATNYMTGATFPSPTLTGVPVAPTASVGTSTTQIATTAFVQAAIVAAYPVGSIYMSTVATNPGTLFGFGTWVAYGQGRMPISADGTYTAGSTGGSATTTLSTTNLPSHTHSFSATSGSPNTSLNHRHYVGSRDSTADNGGNYAQEFVSDAGSGYGPNTYTNYQDLSHTHDISGTTGSAGSGTAVTTISPYIAVYMWNRTA
jgi:microcystin-dependent protein